MFIVNVYSELSYSSFSQKLLTVNCILYDSVNVDIVEKIKEIVS
jgi:hypothetical protein